MPAIKLVRLRNVQRHRDITVEPGPRVTTLVGPTDAGKTTVLRGLEWVCLNKLPRGDTVRHGARFMSGELELDDGSRVRRKKSKSGNTYIVNGEVLKAVGRGDVPAAVRKLLPVDEDSFQHAYDPPFWLTLSAGQVGRNLNAVVDLEIMDRVLARAVAANREAAADLKFAFASRKEARVELESLSWVPKFLSELAALRAEKKTTRQIALNQFWCENALTRWKALTRGVIGARRAKIEGLRAIQTGRELVNAAERLKTAESVLKRLLSIDQRLKLVFPDISGLVTYRAAADEVAERCSVVEGVVSDLESVEGRLKKCQRRKSDLEAELRSRTEGQNCPACGSPMKSSSFSLRTGT